MTREDMLYGLKMTMELCLYDPTSGDKLSPDELRSVNKVTYEACKAAVEILGASDPISRQTAVNEIQGLMEVVKKPSKEYWALNAAKQLILSCPNK